MTTKLAIKHKDSLALKESKVCREKYEIYKQSKLKRCEHLSFPWSILSVFLLYWFVLCPLIWAICCTSRSWPSYWPLLFWTVAFLIWITIMCGLIILWRTLLVKRNPKTNVISKYELDNILNIYQISSKDAKSYETEKLNDLHDSESKKNDRGNFFKKELPPLMIHKQISGENIEDIGIVHVEKDETALDIASNYDVNPLQDYLKLETVPSPDETKSPKTPMSPRELFFIDLIREAEKAENVKFLHFFPSETIEEKMENVENIKEEKNIKDVKDTHTKNEKDGLNKSKRESSYFIADVESPVNEKTEVFLQIDSCVDEQLEKPVLILQSNEENLLKTFIPQDN